MSSTPLELTAAEQALGVSLPHRRMEEWRWTDLRRALTKPYAPAKVEAAAKDVERLLASSPFTKAAKARVVFINGVFEEKYSKLAGLKISDTVGEAHAKGELIDLNRALKATGKTLAFAEQADHLTEIIHIATAASPRAIGLHNRITVAEGATASIIETFLGEGDYVMNSVTEIDLGAGAKLDRLKLQNESLKATHLSHVNVNLHEGSRLNDVTVHVGAALTRQNGKCNFHGLNGDAKINGAYLLRDQQHVDTALVINHAQPHCVSRELFKCVMDDSARGIFQGKVVVARDAQKTDGKQSSHALLLSESAEFDAKPELEIFADDVVCGHGATAGDLNHDHLFYLKSRGIPEAEAKSLLIAAFVGEAFDLVPQDDVRDALVALAEKWVVRA